MFIKVAEHPERFVNTEQIEVVTFLRVGGCALDFRSGRALKVSDNAGRVLLEFVQSNQALLEDDIALPAITGGKDEPVEISTAKISTDARLRSRVAQYLRDGAPNGVKFIDLALAMETTEDALTEALDALITERVVVLNGGNDDAPFPRYFHVTNAPGRLPAATNPEDF